jgi:hypothetical protein
MCTLGRSAIMSVAFLIGAAIAANAQQSSPSRAPNPRLSVLPPPSMAPPAVALTDRARYPASCYHDPYTGGSSLCPQGRIRGPKCEALIPRSRYPQ